MEEIIAGIGKKFENEIAEPDRRRNNTFADKFKLEPRPLTMVLNMCSSNKPIGQP